MGTTIAGPQDPSAESRARARVERAVNGYRESAGTEPPGGDVECLYGEMLREEMGAAGLGMRVRHSDPKDEAEHLRLEARAGEMNGIGLEKAA